MACNAFLLKKTVAQKTRKEALTNVRILIMIFFLMFLKAKLQS